MPSSSRPREPLSIALRALAARRTSPRSSPTSPRSSSTPSARCHAPVFSSSLARAAIGACAGAAAGAFTSAALLPLDAVKTRVLAGLRRHPRTDGSLGPSAVILGSAIYFGTCELAKLLLRRHLPPILVPPLSGASGNISSSAIMVPKELITQRLQYGATPGRCCSRSSRPTASSASTPPPGSATSASVFSYSSFECLKTFASARATPT